MLRFEILSLVPEIFTGAFTTSILGAACRDGLIEVRYHDFREQAANRHHTVDDTPYGGGPGMVIQGPALAARIRAVRADGPPAPVIYLTPQGIRFDQNVARQLVRQQRLILVCGRYEGFDDRVVGLADLELSIGDFVLTGGEFAAMVVVDAVSRFVPGVVGTAASVEADSFYSGRLDHPQYTRPPEWEGRGVPALLGGGHHAQIERWRAGRALVRTAVRRPDLLISHPTSEGEREAVQAALNDDQSP
jgi:tRNA (guanine37-N1)-methyltransferase